MIELIAGIALGIIVSWLIVIALWIEFKEWD